MAIFTYHPFKALYVLTVTALELARFPLWVLLYLPKSTRPHPKWTLAQAIRMKVVSQFLKHSSVVEAHAACDLKPGSEKHRFVTYDAAPASYFKGVTVDSEIKPVRIGGTWTAEPCTREEVQKGNVDVVLHLHGGAYVIGDGRDADTAFLARTILKHARVSHVFTPQYRLSSNPGGRFPAALQDAISSYHYLLHTLSIPASRITFSGDSAGGNLVLALLRYIEDHGDDVGLPRPGAAWLWSPWVDIEAARDPAAMAQSPQYSTDYLYNKFGMWGAREYAPLDSPVDASSGYVSPLGKPFKTSVPLWIQTGDAEVLYADDMRIAEELKGVGNQVELVVSEACPHDIILVGKLAGFEAEARVVAKKAGEWLKEVRTSSGSKL